MTEIHHEPRRPRVLVQFLGEPIMIIVVRFVVQPLQPVAEHGVILPVMVRRCVARSIILWIRRRPCERAAATPTQQEERQY